MIDGYELSFLIPANNIHLLGCPNPPSKLRHMDCHNQKSVFCPVCGKALGSERILRDHTRKVHEKWRRVVAAAPPPAAPRTCQLCSKQFSDMSGLMRHRRNIHKNLVEPPAQFLANCIEESAG